MVNVNINNNIYRAIFEEVPSKEFLERWTIRESPIVEYDERQIWLDRYYKKANSFESEIKRYKIDNINFIKTNIDTLIAQKSFNIIETDIIKSFDKLNQEVAPHGLVFHNRKFIYDPIYNIHLPLYFDGMVEIDQKNSCQKLKKLKWNNSKNREKILFESIVKEYKKRLLDKSHNLEECFIKSTILENNINFKKIIASEIENGIINKNNYFYQYDGEKLQKYSIKYYGYNIGDSKFCLGNNPRLENCKDLNFDQVKNLFSGKLNLKNQKIPFNIGFFNKKKKENILTNNLLKFNLDKDYNYVAKSFTNNFILINKNHEKKTKLKFELMPESRIIIMNSNLINIDISVNSKEYKSTSNAEIKSRYNQNLLTGCLTLIDSKFKDVKLLSNGTKCEDDINIIRSSGEFDNIEIKNSYYDAIDFDFSNIKINNIKITNSGNDCIDFSFGIYLISKANLNNCKDKAISIGEKSIFFGDNISAQNTKIGIANKDSSETYINKISIKNVKNCLDNYKKKKEFELGRVFIVKKECSFNKVKNLNFILEEDFYLKFKDYEKTRI